MTMNSRRSAQLVQQESAIKSTATAALIAENRGRPRSSSRHCETSRPLHRLAGVLYGKRT